MTRITLRSRTSRLAACVAALCGLPACSPSTPVVQQGEPGRTLSAADILRRCAEAYEQEPALQVSGRLVSHRDGVTQKQPFRLTLERPNRARLSVREGEPAQPGRQPLTVVPVGLFFGRTGSDGESAQRARGWRWDGIEFRRGRPCYVLEREEAGRIMRTWLDQETGAVQAWRVAIAGTDDNALTFELDDDDRHERERSRGT